jgi:hypothetical protein
VHTLANHGVAKAILVPWTFGVPILIFGLAAGATSIIAVGAALLLSGVAPNAAQAAIIGISN